MPLAFHYNIRAKGTDFYFNSDNQQSNTLSQNVFIEDFFIQCGKIPHFISFQICFMAMTGCKNNIRTPA